MAVILDIFVAIALICIVLIPTEFLAQYENHLFLGAAGFLVLYLVGRIIEVRMALTRQKKLFEKYGAPEEPLRVPKRRVSVIHEEADDEEDDWEEEEEEDLDLKSDTPPSAKFEAPAKKDPGTAKAETVKPTPPPLPTTESAGPAWRKPPTDQPGDKKADAGADKKSDEQDAKAEDKSDDKPGIEKSLQKPDSTEDKK